MPAARLSGMSIILKLIGRDVAHHREGIGRAQGVGVEARGGGEGTQGCSIGRVVNRDLRARADQQDEPGAVASYRDRDRRG